MAGRISGWQARLGVIAAALCAAACRPASLPTAREGRALYGENGCANCHGDTGHGDGTVSATLDPKPRDFRDVAAFKHGFDVQAIATTIAEGLRKDGVPATGGPGASATHQQGMPKFPHLSEEERQSLALYVISLRARSQTR